MTAKGKTLSTRRARLGASVLATLAIIQAGAVQAQSLIRDTEIEEILHKETDPIFRAAGYDPKDVTILLVGDKELNAFATTGQTIGLNTGLILQTENPNQLAGVVAHETGHLAGGHPQRSGEMMRAGLRPMLLTMGLGVLAALAGSADGAVALAGSASYFGQLGAMGYSREQEGRADQAGAGFLEAAGKSGEGLVEFFDNFRYQEVFDDSRRFAYFRSHPLSSDRIEALRGRVEKLPHFETKDTPEAMAEHAVMKAKLDGFINPQVSLMKYKETDASYPARYARAIAYYQTKEPERALKLIDALLTEQPDNPYLWELKGQILFEFARGAEAEGPQRKSVELKPDAPLLRVNLGQTLINLPDKAKVDEGIAELKKALVLDDDSIDAWRLLGQAYDSKGEAGSARLAAAEYQFAIGDMKQARIFAVRAREQLAKNTPEWRRATDIFLASRPSERDMKQIASGE